MAYSNLPDDLSDWTKSDWVKVTKCMVDVVCEFGTEEEQKALTALLIGDRAPDGSIWQFEDAVEAMGPYNDLLLKTATACLERKKKN